MEVIKEFYKGSISATTDVLEPSENTRFISNIFIKQKSNAAKVSITLNEEPISQNFIMQYGDANIVEANLVLAKGDKLGISVDNKLEDDFNQALMQKLIAIMATGEKFCDIKNGFMLTTKPVISGSNMVNEYCIYDFNLKQIYSIKLNIDNSNKIYMLNNGVIFYGSSNVFFNFLTKKAEQLSGIASGSLFRVGAHAAIYKKTDTASCVFLNSGKLKEIPLTPSHYNVQAIYNNFLITYKNNANAVNLVTGALISSQNSQIMMNVLNNLVYLHNTSSFNTKVYSIDKFEQIINAKFESTGINALCEYQATASLRYNVCNTGVVSVPTSNSIIYGKDGVIAEFSKPSGTQGSSVGATDGKLFFLPLNNNKLGVYASDAEKIAEFDYDFGSSLTTTKVISGKDVILVLTGTQNAHFLYDKTLKTLTPIVLNPVYTLMGDDKNGYEILDSEGNSHYYNLGDKELSQRARGKPEVFVKIDGVEIS